jgi:hypothetical protein
MVGRGCVNIARENLPYPLHHGHRDRWRFHDKLRPRWLRAANDNGALDHVRGQLHDRTFAGLKS